MRYTPCAGEALLKLECLTLRYLGKELPGFDFMAALDAGVNQ